LTIDVKFEINVKQWGRWNCYWCSIFRGILIESKLANFRMLINRTLSVQLKMRLKAFASVILFFFFYLWLVILSARPRRRKLKDKIGKLRSTDCTQRDADELLKTVPSELDKYVVDKEHADKFSFSVDLSPVCFVLDKTSWFVTQNYKLVTLPIIFKVNCVLNDFLNLFKMSSRNKW
jgi:hypothetical protein